MELKWCGQKDLVCAERRETRTSEQSLCIYIQKLPDQIHISEIEQFCSGMHYLKTSKTQGMSNNSNRCIKAMCPQMGGRRPTLVLPPNHKLRHKMVLILTPTHTRFPFRQKVCTFVYANYKRIEHKIFSKKSFGTLTKMTFQIKYRILAKKYAINI